MIWGCISSKGTGRLYLMNSNEISKKYVSILEISPIFSLEDQFGKSDVIFMDNNALCHRSRTMKKFLSENNVPEMK